MHHVVHYYDIDLRRPNSLPLVLIIHRLKEHLYEAGVPRVPQVSLPF